MYILTFFRTGRCKHRSIIVVIVTESRYSFIFSSAADRTGIDSRALFGTGWFERDIGYLIVVLYWENLFHISSAVPTDTDGTSLFVAVWFFYGCPKPAIVLRVDFVVASRALLIMIVTVVDVIVFAERMAEGIDYLFRCDKVTVFALEHIFVTAFGTGRKHFASLKFVRMDEIDALFNINIVMLAILTKPYAVGNGRAAA